MMHEKESQHTCVIKVKHEDHNCLHLQTSETSPNVWPALDQYLVPRAKHCVLLLQASALSSEVLDRLQKIWHFSPHGCSFLYPFQLKNAYLIFGQGRSAMSENKSQSIADFCRIWRCHAIWSAEMHNGDMTLYFSRCCIKCQLFSNSKSCEK